MSIGRNVSLLFTLDLSSSGFFLSGTDKYYRGGYITQTYGSRDTGGPFDAIQMEMPYEMRVDAGQEGRERFASAVGRAMAEYIRMYYTV